MAKIKNDELLNMIVENYSRISDRLEYDSACSLVDYKDSAALIQRLLYKTVKDGHVKWMNGTFYFFTGMIYEPISEDVYDCAIEMFLVSMHVPNRDMYYSLKRFLWKAKQSLRMNCVFHPVFHIWAFRNGVVDMRTGVLYPFSGDFHVAYIHDYVYDPDAKCPLWRSFLREVLPEKNSRLILQMYLGLTTIDRGALSGKVENCLALYGNGSNGKSVINETVRGILGTDNVSSEPMEMLLRMDDEGLRCRAKINGKYINYSDEMSEKALIGKEAAFKSFCSGEEQSGRLIRGNIFTITNVPWQIFNINNIPKSTDSSYGFFRRFLYIVFEYTVPEELQNKSLATELRQEYSGILNWIMRGAKYLKQRRYIFPRSENAEKQKLLSMGENNVTLSWVHARGVRASNLVKGEVYTWIRASVLYDDLLKYAEVNGFDQIDITAFGRQMGKVGFGKQNKVREGKGVSYKVYGCSMDDLNKPVPVVTDMDLNMEDDLDKNVEYDYIDL